MQLIIGDWMFCVNLKSGEAQNDGQQNTQAAGPQVGKAVGNAPSTHSHSKPVKAGSLDVYATLPLPLSHTLTHTHHYR